MKKKISVERTMDEIVSLTNQINGLKTLLANRKALIAKYFEKTGETNLSSDECTIYVQERTNIDYDIDAIITRLPKEKSERFVERTYKIKDWNRFVLLCKQYGLPASKVKQYINIEKQINETNLKNMYDKGLISLDELKGCYQATINKSIALRMKNINKEIQIKK